MPLNEHHFSIIDVPMFNTSTVDEFSKLPIDQYTDGQRSRRFSQYRLTHGVGGWSMTRLPHRPFLQSKEYNPVVGGVKRQFEPLRIDPSKQVIAGVSELELDQSTDWQVNVHMWRVITSKAVKGVTVPEGPHRDGHAYGMNIVVSRENVMGGETQLFSPGQKEDPFFTVTLDPGQAILFDDSKLFHTATDIVSLEEGTIGHRDIFVVAFNRWENRRYGPEFEQRAQSG